MTPEQQRVAIAEWCGWKFVPSHDVGGVAIPEYWENDQRIHEIDELPDYLSDLNAIHEAEERCNSSQCIEYIKRLQDVVGGVPGCFAHHCADAAQRAEALCRTLWPERWAK